MLMKRMAYQLCPTSKLVIVSALRLEAHVTELSEKNISGSAYYWLSHENSVVFFRPLVHCLVLCITNGLSVQFTILCYRTCGQNYSIYIHYL